METLLQDLRFTWRQQLRNPAFFLVAVLTLALGIGATTAIFTVVNAIILRPLPYPQPDRLVQVYEEHPGRGLQYFSVSAANYADWRRLNDSFESMAAYSLYDKNGFTLTSGEQPEPVVSVGVTGEFFQLFGVAPLLGRTFVPEEDRPGNDRVTVLAYDFWQRRFGGDPDVVNNRVELDRESYEVIGIMPAQFRFPAAPEVDLWVPLGLPPEAWQSRTIRPLNVQARLKVGVSLSQARQEMKRIADNLRTQYPAANEGFTADVYRMQDRMVSNARTLLLVLAGSVVLVLLIACVNVANLLLARGAVRQRELGLRLALGAGVRRLLRQLLTEGVVLALCGGLLGLMLAHVLVRLMVTRTGAYLPRADEIAIDPTVLLFALLLALVTGVVFSLVPALQTVMAIRLTEVVGEGGRSGTSGRSQAWLRKGLVIVELTLALVLLIGASLMLRSFGQLQQVDPGFEPDSILSFQITLPGAKYRSPSEQNSFVRQLVERLEGLPGVERAATINRLPLSSLPFLWDFFEEGSPPASLDQVQLADFRNASSAYFEALGIPVVQGRGFSDQDREGAVPVLVINEAMQRQFWPDGAVLGKRLEIGNLVAEQLPGLPMTVEIVGVVGDVHQFQLSQPPTPLMYLPFEQYPFATFFVALETRGAPKQALSAVRGAVRELDPFVPLSDVQTLEERVDGSISGQRLGIYLLGGFAAVALFLAAVGIYGVISYSVAQRTKEMGIRTALGAEPAGLTRLVVGQGLRLAAYGLGLGLLLAAVASGLLRSLLFGVSGFDPLAFAASALILAAVAALACLVPALRAARVDPMVALRSE